MVERIKKFTILYKYINDIYSKYSNNCIKKYEKSGKQLLRIGNKIILEEKLGRSGSYGVVYKASFRTNKKDIYNPYINFAVKICEITDDNANEINIAQKLDNSLINDNIFHFPLLYGFLKCNTDSLHDYYSSEDSKNSLKHTHSSFDSNYNSLLNKQQLYFQIYEIANGNVDSYYSNIINPLTLEIASNELVFNALAQIFMSVYYFHIIADMQHDDTHFGNFLFHKIEIGTNFKYQITENISFYIKNIGYLWVINDFGLAKPFSNSIKIKQILKDYKYILTNALEYTNYYIDNNIENCIIKLKQYLDVNLYSGSDTEISIITKIMNCIMDYSNTVSLESSI